ncbi:exosome component 10 [Plakobranchus ocellatus]|uniref:Exosome complex component 10 homolog n=1 Tax=Plakobranchus ocellatus TaxID=259542 RepID=A0AAV4A3F5_9GAST|nr:exosome component 10 [Plakobranchus ocellatus]
MATPMDDVVPDDEEIPTTSCPIPGHPDVNDFSQKALKSVLKATRSSNDLPVGDDFDFYSTFRSVRDVLDIEGQRILALLKRLLRNQNVKGNLSHGDAVEIDDQFDVLMDANDQILERAGSLLDEASGIRKEETKLVITSVSMNQPKPSSSWNKKASVSSGKTPVSYSLMTARNIQRPQLRFLDKIDNSNSPFKPALRVKPNPVKSLEESLKLPEGVQPEDAERPNFHYPNPYQPEIDAFTPSQECLQRVTPQEPQPLNLTPLMMVTTEKQLSDMIKDLKKQREIAVDLEHHSYRSFQGITCLMQISTRTHDYIVDTLELRNHLEVLNEVFTDPNIVKVLHGADSDIGWLQRDFNVYVVNIFDTGQAARVLGLSRFSLAHLLLNYCQVEADKQFQLADWRIRPLPQELINYAREDTHFLLYIYDMMRNQLLDRSNATGNLLLSVYERSKAVAAKVFQKPIFTDQDYLELYKKSKKVFNNQQLTAMKDLYAWRDSMARIEDESLGYVLPNHMLLQIAEILPREKQGVLACCNPIPPLVRQSLMEIHAMVLQAREVALIKVEKRPIVQPSNLQHPKYDIDSLLNCPHDMSQVGVQPADSVMPFLEQGLVSESGTMFNGKTSEVTLKATPSVTAYEWKNNQILTRSAASVKAEKVKACFSNPFAKFMPKSIRGFELSMKQADKWTMKASNVKSSAPDKKKRKADNSEVDLDTFEPEYIPPSKRSKASATDALSSSTSSGSIFRVPSVPPSSSTAAETSTTSTRPSKSLFSVPASAAAAASAVKKEVEKKIKSLREEVNVQKKKKKKALKEKEKRKTEREETSEASSVSEDLQCNNNQTNNSNSSSTVGASSSLSSSDQPASTPASTTADSSDTHALMSRKEKKKEKKNKKLTIEQVEENFSAFDYSAAEQALNKKKKEKKSADIFNPALPSRSGKDKNKAKKPKLSGANSNKLFSFGPSAPGQGLLRRIASLRRSRVLQQWLQRYGWEILPHPAHSPDLAPSDFHLFGPLKRHLGGMAFKTEDDLISELRNWFDNLDFDFFRVGINSLLCASKNASISTGITLRSSGRVNFNLCEFQIYLIKTL